MSTSEKPLRIAAVLFEDFEMLDLYGPLEVFSMHRSAFQIVTVAETAGPVRASGGPATVAERSFDDTAPYDLILVPGGRGVRQQIFEPAMLDWLKRAAQDASIISSVCTGSLLLAKAGLLDGRRATTNKVAFDWVAQQVRSVDWQRRARWVWDADQTPDTLAPKSYVTSSGVSAGIDMALAIIEQLLGARAASDAALWAEHSRNADPDHDPFATPSGDTP